MNGILYVLRGSIPLAHDAPRLAAVGHGLWHFRNWRDDGAWERAEEAFRARVREAEGRAASPSAAITDSQSVKTTAKGGPEATTQAKRSPDASTTSYRNTLVLIPAVAVHTANVQDRDSAKLLGRSPRLWAIPAGWYSGPGASVAGCCSWCVGSRTVTASRRRSCGGW